MSASQVLQAARDAGIRIKISGDKLSVEGPARTPSDMLEQLRHHKFEIMTMLNASNRAWPILMWRSLYERRLAIAFDYCVVEWMDRNPVYSMPGRCLVCGAIEQPHDPVVPFGIGPIGRAWLHPDCWPAWHNGRRQAAIAALAEMEIRDHAGVEYNIPET